MANPERPLLEPAKATTLQAPHANTCNCPQTCKDLSGNSSVGLLNVISEVALRVCKELKELFSKLFFLMIFLCFYYDFF